MEACQCQRAALKMAKLMWPSQMRSPLKGTLHAGLDVESKCSAIIKVDKEASGYYRSEAEPSDVQDQPATAAGSAHAGHQSDEEDPHDGNQSINSCQSKESATCEKVIKLLTEVTDS